MELLSFDLHPGVSEPIGIGEEFKVVFEVICDEPGESGVISLSCPTDGYAVTPASVAVRAPAGQADELRLEKRISITGPAPELVTIDAYLGATDSIIVNVE